MKTIQELAAENVQQTLENGPGIRYTTNIFIIAKDLKNGLVMLGGLGGMGVGQMWVQDVDLTKKFEGYAEAPDINTTTHSARLNYMTGEVDVWERKGDGA